MNFSYSAVLRYRDRRRRWFNILFVLLVVCLIIATACFFIGGLPMVMSAFSFAGWGYVGASLLTGACALGGLLLLYETSNAPSDIKKINAKLREIDARTDLSEDEKRKLKEKILTPTDQGNVLSDVVGAALPFNFSLTRLLIMLGFLLACYWGYNYVNQRNRVR